MNIDKDNKDIIGSCYNKDFYTQYNDERVCKDAIDKDM